jgi:hydroxyacylglutathione hydrolase
MSTVSEASVSTFTVAQFNCLGDNYGYLLHDPSTGETAAVDTPCGKTYKEELERRGWKLTHILNTHHHHDHTGGNLELKEKGVTIVGPVNEKQKIPGIDKPVGDGDAFEFGNSNVVVMDAGGHTKGHVAYYFPDQSKVFVGDCLFSLGCGKMFEGNPIQFWSSLEGLRALPDDTLVYCGHEYTQSNGKFAMSVEPGNKDLVDRVALVKAKRARNEPTVPSLLGEEKKANPFLRVDFSEEIRKNIGVADDDTPAEAFAKLRKAKDNF